MLRVLLVMAPPKKAQILARQVLEERLAACVNVVRPVNSLYWWKGKIDHAEEALLIIKTTKHNVMRLMKRVRMIHPYEVPEILVLPVEAAHPPYVKWVEAETQPPKQQRRSRRK